MSAADALNAARDAGVELHLDGDDLLLEAAAPPPAAVLNLLLRNKSGIVALLRPRRDGWSAEDWHVFFEERSGIREHDGGQQRVTAEQGAVEDCVAQWLALTPPLADEPSAGCLACGKSDDHRTLVPHLTRGGHFWLHASCWDVYLANRRKLALIGLRIAWPSMPGLCPDIRRKIEEGTSWSAK